MKSFIRMVRVPYEEPDYIHLIFSASNGETSATLEYYDHASSLKEWAEALENFPRHITSVFLHELGSERPEDPHAFYFRMRVFTTDNLGHCAIQLRLNNNQPLPFGNLSEFCIPADAADINRFGTLCRQFAMLKHEVLEWRNLNASTAIAI